MFHKRLNIFTGHFGSGKTEVAVNYALKLSELFNKVSIVDFDIVNPYFRTTDARSMLESKNLWVIAPLYANTNVDVPSLPPEINTILENKEYRAVFDVGGDDVGARVLSRYKEEILNDDYEMYFVINIKRPMTENREKIKESIFSIQDSSGIKVTKLVNNTNLLGYTFSEDIIEGQKVIEVISKELNIPIGFTSGFHEFIHPVKETIGTELLCLNKYIKLPWE